jgi:hypothetical protein
MAERWLYQIKVLPPLPEALQSEALELKWFKPLSEPSELLEVERYLATLYDQWAAQEALVFGEGAWDNNPQAWDDSTRDWEGTEIAPDLSWHSPWREPADPIAALHASLHQTTAIDPFLLLQPELAQVDKWFKPLNEPPDDVEPLATGAKPFFTIDTDQLLQGEDITLDKWFVRFPDSVDEDPSVVEFMAFRSREAIEADLAADVTVDSWFQNLSIPTPPVEGLVTGAQQFTTYDSEAFTKPEETQVDKWFQPLRDPIQIHEVEPLPIAAMQFFRTDRLSLLEPEEVSIDRWMVRLNEPLFDIDPLPTGAKPFFSIDTDQLLQPEVTTPDKWWPTFADMVHDVPSVAEFMPFRSREGVEADFEIVTSDKWFQPLSEPLYDVPPLPEGAKQSFAIDTVQLLQPEDITVDKWFAKLNEPVLPPFDPNLMGINHFFYGPDPILIEVITVDKWYQPLRDPTELRDLGLPVALMPFFIMDAQFKLGFIGERPVTGAWVPEGAAAGVWGAEGPASGTWTEEGPEC